jgi:hypothetical protein
MSHSPTTILHLRRSTTSSKIFRATFRRSGWLTTRKSLEDMRMEKRASLPNAEVQRQFDQGSRRQFGYTVKEMAGHAATENKKYQNAASNGRIASAAQSAAALNAQDDEMFAVKYAEARKTAEEAQDVKGFRGAG